jgi:hypothetical protein
MPLDVWTAAAVVTGVGVCIVNELNATPESGGVPPGMRIIYLTPGNVAWDGCECGQLAQSIQVDYISNQFPVDTSQQPRQGVGCNLGPLAYQVLVSLTRCVPGMTGTVGAAKPPTPAKLIEAALIMEGDAWAVRTAVECCLVTMKHARPPQIFDFRIGQVQRVGPEGGCAGIEMQYWFQLM